MWKEGTIGFTGEGRKYKVIKYQAKVYDEGSKYGIDGGRISKLWLTAEGKTLANYDRGWDIEPTCEEARIALEILLKENS